MNNKLLQKLMEAGKDPAMYGIGVEMEVENEMDDMEDDSLPELNTPSEDLFSHTETMRPMIESASPEEVMMFLSEILRMKGF